MPKNKAKTLTIAFHVSILLLMMFFTIYRSDVSKREYIDDVSTDLHGITKTISIVGSNSATQGLIERFYQGTPVEDIDPDYLRITTDFRHILLTNGLEDCELSFILIDKKEKHPIRLISSDKLYSFGERIFDRDGLLRNQMDVGGSAVIEVNEDIKKIMAFDPVKNESGETIGVVRIETGDCSAKLQAVTDVYWMVVPFLIYLLIATVYTILLYRKREGLSNMSEENTISNELKKKNNELKMLSLVAKKSENLMLITDERGHILWVNETYEEKNNFSAEELNKFAGKYLHEVSQNESIRTIIKNVVDFNEPITYESCSKDSQGKCHYAMTTVTPISDEDGHVSNLLFVDTDITLMKRAEKQHHIFRELVEKCSIPRVVAAKNGDIIYSNKAAKPLLKAWSDSDSMLKSDILAMLTSIYDIGKPHAIRTSVSGIEMGLTIYPELENDFMMIISDGIIAINSTNEGNKGSDIDYRKAV
jgi:PAS domain S-box-containing protein